MGAVVAQGLGRASGYPPIGDYALIGDCHTAALVSRDGSIDWFCPHRFDAPAVFCRVLDWGRGGYFQIAPVEAYEARRRYRGRTNVLETTFSTASGQVRLTDFKPIHRRDDDPRGEDVELSGQILRLVEALGGEVEVAVAFKPTFDFTRAPTRVTVVEGRGAVAEASGSWVTLACPGATLAPDGGGGWRATLRLRAGERRWVVLTMDDDPHEVEWALDIHEPDAQLAETLAYWEEWASRCTYRGPYREAVVRSALTLKLLTYEPTGAIVAAPTTSLPEAIGGPRNWDYRFTWLRDSSLILYALISVGYHTEARDFYDWLHDVYAPKGAADLQIMYGIDGERDLTECEIPELEGYRGSRPVRVGNGAATQRQLDIYGELLVTACLFWLSGEGTSHAQPRRAPPPPAMWTALSGLAEQAAAVWQEPDAGIWEVRGGPQLFLYSRLQCWAALDRALRIAHQYQLEAPRGRWASTRDAIREAILTRGYDAQQGAFTQAFGSTALDASALVIPTLGFLPATDPRFRSTIDRIQEKLVHQGLVSRYHTDETDDGLAGGEGAFVLCTFWLVDALALSGRLEEARALFERTIGHANDVGLLAEEIDPASGAQLGNFPQGFSHLALIRSAVDLARAAKRGAETEAETETDRMGPACRAAEEQAGA